MLVIFAFTNEPKGTKIPYTLHKDFQSVYIFAFSDYRWIKFYFDKRGIQHKETNRTAGKLLSILKRQHKVKTILIADVENPVSGWYFPLMIQSCNEIMRYLTGVDVGVTLNPFHLYRKLLKYDKKRNYSILFEWTKNGRSKIRERPRPKLKRKHVR